MMRGCSIRTPSFIIITRSCTYNTDIDGFVKFLNEGKNGMK